MGREKMKMKKIVDISARQVTFCKRRKGLFKKASELSILSDAEVGVVVFSPAGKLHHYASSNIEDILNKFSSYLDNERHRATFQGKNKNSCSDLSKRIEDNMDPLRGIEELQQQEMKLEAILGHVIARKKELLINEVDPALQEKEFQKEHTIIESSEIRHCGQEIIPGPINLEGSSSFPYFQTTKNLSSPETWIPPPPDIYKANFAGAIFQEMKASGIGIIFRNWRGEFMAALAKFFPEQMDENATSSMAAKSAVEFAADYYFTHIILEGDRHDIIENSDEVPADHLPAFGTGILPDAKRFIQQLEFCIFSHVCKSGNVAAHMVAQYAINVKDEVVWLMKEPEFLADILLAEAVHLNS